MGGLRGHLPSGTGRPPPLLTPHSAPSPAPLSPLRVAFFPWFLVALQNGGATWEHSLHLTSLPARGGPVRGVAPSRLRSHSAPVHIQPPRWVRAAPGT